MKASLVWIGLIFIGFFNAQAQGIWDDKASLDKLHTAIDHIYNLDFPPAEAIIRELEPKLGGHPSLTLLKAFRILWKYKPLKEGTEKYDEFVGYLQMVLEHSSTALSKDKNNIEAIFFKMSAHGYLAQLYVDNGLKMKALTEAKNAYSYMNAGFEYKDIITEFLFPCGIYNYYREKYPEENPFYKPFLWFFRSGDKEQGIAMLKEGARKNVFTQVECFNYLFHIYFRYEYKPTLAEYYIKTLNQKYPKNHTYTSGYVELLLYKEQFAQALPLIEKLQNANSFEHRYHGAIFYGIYQELSQKNYVGALKSFHAAENLASKVELRSSHHDSLLFLGLGRVHSALGNKTISKDYLKKSSSDAEYSFVRDEAKKLLSSK